MERSIGTILNDDYPSALSKVERGRFVELGNKMRHTPDEYDEYYALKLKMSRVRDSLLSSENSPDLRKVTR